MAAIAMVKDSMTSMERGKQPKIVQWQNLLTQSSRDTSNQIFKNALRFIVSVLFYIHKVQRPIHRNG